MARMSHARTVPSRPGIREAGLLAALGFTVVAAAIGVVAATGGAFWGTSQTVVVVMAGTICYAAVGVAILWRRPGNGIGRLALAIGLAFSAGGILDAIVRTTSQTGLVRRVVLGPAAVFFDVAPALSEILLVGGLVVGGILLIAWFPSGRRSSRLGGLVEICLALGIVGAIVGAVEDPILRAIGWSAAIEALFDIIVPAALLLIIAAYLIAIVDLIGRYRRAGAIERLQIRWVLAAVMTSVVLMVAVILFAESVSALWDLFVASLMLPIVAIAVALTRYRLYDIDRIVSSTIAYSFVTVVLLSTLAVAIVALQAILAPLTNGDTLAVAGSTLLVAALFQPLRARVQRTVDRRFHRARFDAERTVESFAGRLRDQLDLATLSAELSRATVEAVEPRTTTIWLRGAKPS
jgi:MFS family permease